MSLTIHSGKKENLFGGGTTGTSIYSSPGTRAYSFGQFAWADEQENGRAVGSSPLGGSSSTTISVVTTSTGVTRTLGPGRFGAACINKAGTRAYAPVFPAFVGGGNAELRIYDITVNATPSLLSTITLSSSLLRSGSPIARIFAASALSPDETKMYIVDVNTNTLVGVNLSTNAEFGAMADRSGIDAPGTSAAGTYLGDIEVSADGTKVFVTGYVDDNHNGTADNNNRLMVYDASTLARLDAVIPDAILPSGLSVSRDGEHVAVAMGTGKKVYILDADTHAILQTIDYSSYTRVRDVVYSIDNNRLYVALEGATSADHRVDVLDYTNSYASLGLVTTVPGRLAVGIWSPAGRGSIAVHPLTRETFTSAVDSNDTKVYRSASNAAAKVLHGTITGVTTGELEFTRDGALRFIGAHGSKIDRTGTGTFASE